MVEESPSDAGRARADTGASRTGCWLIASTTVPESVLFSCDCAPFWARDPEAVSATNAISRATRFILTRTLMATTHRYFIPGTPEFQDLQRVRSSGRPS